MTTCPSCGSETAEGVTCVVCGAGPVDPAETRHPDAGTDPTGQSGELVGATAAGATGTAADLPANGPSDPHGGHPHPGQPGAVPPGAGWPGALPPPAPGAAAVWPAVPQPHPDALVITENSRNWAMIAHLSALVAAGAAGGLAFLGPLAVWLVRKDQDRYVAHHALEALNFNLSMMLYAILAVALGFTIIGLVVAIPMAIAGFFLWFITSIVAAVRAQRGEGYRYPLTIRLVKE